MDERELSIDSTEAYDIAESLSERLGKSTTEIVLDALRRLDRETGLPDVAGLTPERRAEHERFMPWSTATNLLSCQAPHPITATCMTSSACRYDGLP
jgi:hypothetical protein